MNYSAVQTYNGWSNRETWLASLWLNNDGDAYYAVLQEALREAGDAFDQADWLERYMREQMEDEIEDACLMNDLLSTAFTRINWVEVIEHSQ
jgi:hypothetical protein